MKTENIVLMRKARESLEGKWDIAIGTFVVYLVLTFFVQLIPFAGIIIGLFVNGPIAVGLVIFSLSLARNKKAKLEQIFEGFQDYSRAVEAYILLFAKVFVWTLLFIVPGVIAALSYAMTYYILVEDPKIGAMEAIKKSIRMMEGSKEKLFRLNLRFFGLGLLCILTLGIGFLWLIPYMHVTYAKFYEDIKDVK
jgi:uncharacterized membrane protein